MKHLDEIYAEGREKQVSPPDDSGYIIKSFKAWQPLFSYDEQKKILNTKKQYFGEYIPDTELIVLDKDNYVIKQKFVDGKLLKDVDIEDLSAEALGNLLDLLQKYICYCKEQNAFLDTIGYHQYKNNIWHWERKFRNFLKIYKNFLLSTNIMITPEWKVFMVDICDTKKQQSSLKKFSKEFFIPLTLDKISKLIAKKQLEITKTLQGEK